MSSSFFNPSPQDQEPETPPKPEAPNPVPIAAESLPPVPELPPELAAHQAILAVLIARFAAFFGKSFDQARAIVVSLFGQYRALAQARGLRFEPGWIGEALDETDQAKAARRIKRGTPWTYFLGVLGNYARQGGPIREGPTEHQARATLEELSALGWTIVLKNDGTAAWGQIRAEACPLEELPESLSRRIKEQKEAIQALLEARQKPSQSWNPRS